MEVKEYAEKINALEEQVYCCVDLLEVAKEYCDSNLDKSKEISRLGTFIRLLLQEQYKLVNCLEEFVIN